MKHGDLARRSRARFGVVAGLVAGIVALLAPAATAQVQVSRPNTPVGEPIHSLIEKNCQVCHNAALPNGAVDLQRLISSSQSFSNEKLTWTIIANSLSIGRMPPVGAPRPPQADLDRLVAAINSAVASAPPPTRPPPPPPPLPTNDWLTFSYDPERTGWNRAEKSLTRDNVGKLELLWKVQLDALPNTVNRYSSMTDPVVAQDVKTPAGSRNLAFVASADNDIYAIDVDRGTVFWKKSFPNLTPPTIAASNSCPNNLNATPVIDRTNSVIYVLPNDGRLRGLNLADGAEKFPATPCVPPYSRNFSLNLVDGMIYTSTTRGCGGAISEIVGVNVLTREVHHFYASTGKASGPWGRGGIVKYPYGMLAQTADGAFDPGGGRWGQTMLGLNKFVRLVDSYTPIDEREMNARDFDFGSTSPVVFPFDKWTLVVTSSKEGSIFLLDAAQLGGGDHRTPLYRSPRYSNDPMTFTYTGMWSVMSTYVDAQGQRWLLAPFYGPVAKDTVGSFPKQHGEVVNGSLMAFKVVLRDGKPALDPAWTSLDLDLPGIAVVANNLIYIVANGDRAANAISGARPRGAGAADTKGGPITSSTTPGVAVAGRPLPLTEVNPNEPGYERDAAWRADQLRPFEAGGQKNGTRFTGGNQRTNAILYVLDPATGDVVYASGDAIDSWSHYGGIALANGRVYVSTYDNRLYAFGVT
jgi:outer membrane protein assembly factor BamB